MLCARLVLPSARGPTKPRLGPRPAPTGMPTVGAILRTALQEGRFHFNPRLADVRRKIATRSPEIDFPTRISIENKSHPTCTLIQVEMPDRLGLLYDLVSCLGRNNVYITLSRISTEKGAAIDTFYVIDASTRAKITDAGRIEQLHQQLHEATLARA